MKTEVCLGIALWTVVSAFCTANPVDAQPPIDPCAGSARIMAGESAWIGETSDRRREWLAIEVHEPGRLAVQAEGSAGGGHSWIELREGSCVEPTSVRIFRRGGWIQVERPSVIYLRAGSVEPVAGETWRELRVSTLPAPSQRIPDKHGEQYEEPGDETEEEDDEIMPFAQDSKEIERGLGEP